MSDKDWNVTVKIGSRVTVWVITAPSALAARRHAELQLKHRGGSVIKVEEAT